jgi:predicted aspartyl protease
MGEVHVQVRLVNAIDEGLARRGLLTADQVRSHLTDAVVDTGSAYMVLPRAVAERLGLAVRGREVAYLASGRREDVDVTEPFVVEIEGRTTVDEAVLLGDEVLIGQTVLEKLDFLVDCHGQRIISNPRHPEGWGHTIRLVA